MIEQIRKDLAYIKDNYGEIEDHCGIWCNCDVLNTLLNSPTEETAFEILKSKINHYFNWGYTDDINKKLPIESDAILQEIKERWC